MMHANVILYCKTKSTEYYNFSQYSKNQRMIVKQKPFCSLFILEFDRKYTTEFKLMNLCKGLSFPSTELSMKEVS